MKKTVAESSDRNTKLPTEKSKNRAIPLVSYLESIPEEEFIITFPFEQGDKDGE